MREHEWRPWLKGLGATIRRAREIAGLTQSELAKCAGTSQGGISRLEQGRGACVPLIGVLCVVGTLRDALELLPDATLDDEVRFLLDLSGARQPRHTVIDPDLAILLEAYRALSVALRTDFVRVATVTADALTQQTANGRGRQ